MPFKITGVIYTIPAYQKTDKILMLSKKFTIVISLSFFIIGYFSGSEIEKIQTLKKLNSIADRINVIDNKLSDFSFNTNHKQNDLLQLINKLDKQVQAINLQQVNTSKNKQLQAEHTVQNNKIELKDLTYNELIEKLDKNDPLEQRKIIQNLMLEGSPEIKQQLIELALDENADKHVRYATIEATNWQNHGKELTDMVNNTTDINTIGSALEGAKQSVLNPSEKQQFDKTLTGLFQQNRDDVPQAAIIDYFKNEGDSDFTHFLSQIEIKNFPIELQQQIKLLQTPNMTK